MTLELLATSRPDRAEWATLGRALGDLADRGRRTPCQVDPAPFHADDVAERREAAAACRACPALFACAAAALAGDERFGVWAGVDLTPRPGPSNRGREQLAALLEGAAPEAAETPSESPGPVVRPCAQCGSAFVAKTKRARFCGGACRTRANRTPLGATASRPGVR